jgi:hypothetical protein
MASNVDRAERAVVAKRSRDDVRFVVGTRGGDAAEALARQVVDLGGGEFGHGRVNTASPRRLPRPRHLRRKAPVDDR